MLSGRRLLIGDHHQLPPFEADRLVKILGDHGLVAQALELSESYVGPLLRDGEIEELDQIASSPEVMRAVADTALRLFEPFRSVVEEDERRHLANANHRRISSVLTEQRRMDPAIATIVSEAFYEGALKTFEGRVQIAETQLPKFSIMAPLPTAPVTVINFKHISATGQGAHAEAARPRWHNPGEVQSVVDVLRHIRGKEQQLPSLVILSFYSAQVDRLSERIDAGFKNGELAHLTGFAPALPNGKWVSTVDGFQGNEADLVILSLVRNNAGSGARALGFLRDKRRMNVALSRAKSKLVIVGSLSFLSEAVRGVNPDAGVHDLSFITTVIDTITMLEKIGPNGEAPRAKCIDPSILASNT